jgi:hypothetical protein
MTFNEFKVLAKGMKAVYTAATFLPDEDSIKIWYRLLQDIPYEVANIAIQRHMMTNKFPPTIAEIREQAALSVNNELNSDWGQSWEQVYKAIRTYGLWGTEEAFASMDDITRQCVKRLGWKELCMSETPMQDRANFRMIFEELKLKTKQESALPLNIKESIAKLQSKQKMIGERK